MTGIVTSMYIQNITPNFYFYFDRYFNENIIFYFKNEYNGSLFVLYFEFIRMDFFVISHFCIFHEWMVLYLQIIKTA